MPGFLILADIKVSISSFFISLSNNEEFFSFIFLYALKLPALIADFNEWF